jgi:SpoIID/LytB domain protein
LRTETALRLLHLPIALIVALGLACGCTWQPQTTEAWRTHSLDQGPDVRIRIFRKYPATQLTVSWPHGKVLLTDATGAEIEPLDNARELNVRYDSQADRLQWRASPGPNSAVEKPNHPDMILRVHDGTLLAFTVRLGRPSIRRVVEAKQLRFTVKAGQMMAIATMPLERYIARVLPNEMDPNVFTMEALQAQAVVARTWALKNLRRHGRFGYAFCDEPHCQVFRGSERASERAERAVKKTWGQVLWFRQQPAEAFYHSTCGGNTVYLHEAWPAPYTPYLIRVEDQWRTGFRAYCADSPHSRWRLEVPYAQLTRWLQRQRKIKVSQRLVRCEVDSTNLSGRVKTLLCTLDDAAYLRLDIRQFRVFFGPPNTRYSLPSNFFTLSGNRDTLAILGQGLGHGVGLCQWGAQGLAMHGFTYREILEHYFPGTELHTLEWDRMGRKP